MKVVWSREDDIKFDAFHSVAAMYFKASLGADGKPTAWLQRSVFPPIASTFDPKGEYADAGEIGLGFSDLPFAVPNQRAENGPAPAHTRIGWLRSVANIYHAYGIHSFVGELANAAGKDQVEYVLTLLGTRPNRSEKMNCRRIIRTTTETTSNTQWTSPDSAAWCNWRRKNQAGVNRSWATDSGWASRYIVASSHM